MDLSCNVIAISPNSGYIPPHHFVLEFLYQWGSLSGLFNVSRVR